MKLIISSWDPMDLIIINWDCTKLWKVLSVKNLMFQTLKIETNEPGWVGTGHQLTIFKLSGVDILDQLLLCLRENVCIALVVFVILRNISFYFVRPSSWSDSAFLAVLANLIHSLSPFLMSKNLVWFCVHQLLKLQYVSQNILVLWQISEKR